VEPRSPVEAAPRDVVDDVDPFEETALSAAVEGGALPPEVADVAPELGPRRATWTRDLVERGGPGHVGEGCGDLTRRAAAGEELDTPPGPVEMHRPVPGVPCLRPEVGTALVRDEQDAASLPGWLRHQGGSVMRWERRSGIAK
jgi:hypothetical protein